MAKKQSLLVKAKADPRRDTAPWYDRMPDDDRQEMLDVIDAYNRGELKHWSARYLHSWLKEHLASFDVGSSTFREFVARRREGK